MPRDPLAGLRRPTDAELNAVRSDPRFLANGPKADEAFKRVWERACAKLEAQEVAEIHRHDSAMRAIREARSAAREAAREAFRKVEYDAYAVALARIIRRNG